MNAPEQIRELHLRASDGAIRSKLVQPWRWLGNRRTVRMFRDDRVLLVGTLILAASALWPLWTTPILPLVDMGSNLGAACLLDDVALGQGVAAQYYEINLRIVPYWTVYLLIAVLAQLAGALLAAKIAVGVVVVLLPVTVMRLLLALGRSPRLGLWAFMLAWDNNLYWGWITFQYGMVLALFVIAKLVEMRDVRDAAKIVPLAVLTALTHVHAVALLLTVGGLLGLGQRPLPRSLLRHAVALCGCALPLLPWLWSKLGGTAGSATTFAFDFHSPRHKVQNLFTYSIDNLPGLGAPATAAGFVLLSMGCMILFAFEQRKVAPRQLWAPSALLLGSALLYFGLPFAISGPVNHWYTYPRYATYLLIALLCLPRPLLQGAASLVLVPGVVTTMFIHYGIAAQFREYGDYVRPYLEVIASIAKGSRILPVDLDDYRFRGTREAVLGQLHGYAAAVTSSFDPHLFDEPNNPIRFRAGTTLPHPNWFRPTEFTMEAHGQYYDYVIVHPVTKDPIARRKKWRDGVVLAKDAGPFRLYRVKSPAAAGK
jgi:hypothetical protein